MESGHRLNSKVAMVVDHLRNVGMGIHKHIAVLQSNKTEDLTEDSLTVDLCGRGRKLDFSNLELVCPIDVDDISNRWSYMPVPGQTVKEYPAGIAVFIFRILKPYAGVAVHCRGILPSIRAKQLVAQPAGSPRCLSLVRDRYDDEALFAAFQAYLIYSLVLFFRLSQARSDFFRRAMTNLQELACSSSHWGLMCAADLRRVRPRWEEWIVTEAKRRTLYVMYLFDRLMPADLGEFGIAKRRPMVDDWLENIDEFGTVFYAWPPSTEACRAHWQITTPAMVPPTDAPPEARYSIFDKRQRWLIIAIVSTAATFSGFASNIYFPALPTIADDLNVSLELVNLTVTSYLIIQGLALSLWGPVSDVKGRRIAYIYSFIVFLCTCIGLALRKNYAALVVLRCLQSTGSASTIAIGSGVVGDITTRAEREGYMGPISGGALAWSLGWHSVFWCLAIYSGVFLILLALLLPRTLWSKVANGSLKPSNPVTRYPLNIYQRSTKPAARKNIDILESLRMLVTKQATPIILFLAVYYAVSQMSITAMSSIFNDRYGLGEIQIGLTFIANGVGSTICTLVTGKILNIDYQRMKQSYEASLGAEAANDGTRSEDDFDDFSIARARLRHVPLFSLLQCPSIILFGWTIQYPDHSVIMTYLVDIFPGRSAVASAGLNLARCLFAASGTSFIMPMVNGVGVGAAFTICVAVQLVALVGPFVQWKFAGVWRKQAQDGTQLWQELSVRVFEVLVAALSSVRQRAGH
ncbi:major facilitator superfamily domain-containing protein [Aspergillus alliaceus]|uniref:major facilitator superfamily domain-containing protein n=1 Tax=Petromyces alliaceus TaxID=209559 RepID=UPI0012A4AAF6|nr:major facilitator superfamily domain-containing protein [Aspergillus alliaceus]KAB8236906.1 major facilitator superfamily domain-containing protein [Aspergillus alliaceus]